MFKVKIKVLWICRLTQFGLKADYNNNFMMVTGILGMTKNLFCLLEYVLPLFFSYILPCDVQHLNTISVNGASPKTIFFLRSDVKHLVHVKPIFLNNTEIVSASCF
jgi:hypothetical protein